MVTVKGKVTWIGELKGIMNGYRIDLPGGAHGFYAWVDTNGTISVRMIDGSKVVV